MGENLDLQGACPSWSSLPLSPHSSRERSKDAGAAGCAGGPGPCLTTEPPAASNAPLRGNLHVCWQRSPAFNGEETGKGRGRKNRRGGGAGSGEGGSNDIKRRREKAQKKNNETERFCSLLLWGKQSSNKTRLAINVGICIHWSVKRQAKGLWEKLGYSEILWEPEGSSGLQSPFSAPSGFAPPFGSWQGSS